MREHLKHHQIAIGKLVMGFVYNIGMRVRTTLHQKFVVLNLKENFDRGIFAVHRNHQLFAKEQSTENLVLQIKFIS